MNKSIEAIMSGAATGIGASIARSALSIASPMYRAAVSLRNRRYDRGIGVRKLPKPVICIGNITTGGTGKTPTTIWLAGSLSRLGLKPAVLLRGYKSSSHGVSDEAALLSSKLGPNIPVHARPDRFAGGIHVLQKYPETDVFILDDGFQHRRLHRDFDLVLIDATNPFGYERLLPRGLLREPIAALERASAVLMTRASSSHDLLAIESRIASIKQLPIYRCNHVHVLQNDLTGKRVLAFCGIGNPESFRATLNQMGVEIGEFTAFADHHEYTTRDIEQLHRRATQARATVLLTTEKDLVKVNQIMPPEGSLQLRAVEIGIGFCAGDEARLLQQIMTSVRGLSR